MLGQPRHDDTPGWLIPQLYFDYLRDGDARRLRGVFEHNQRDILALAALAGHARPASAASARMSRWLCSKTPRSRRASPSRR